MPTPPTSPALDALLARRPDEMRWLGLPEIAGFFFALGAAPQLVPPSEWMELVFGDEGPEADSMEELNAAVQTLFALYNEAMSLARGEERIELPPWLEVLPEAGENVGGEAPLAGWSRGFRYGHLWLEELWDVSLPEEVEEEYTGALVCLCFFGLDEALPEMLEEMGADEDRLADVARTMVDALPDAMATYALLGRTLEEVLGMPDESEGEGTLAPPGPMPGPIGRNDPCPCGSGRKFKRCCGRLAH